MSVQHGSEPQVIYEFGEYRLDAGRRLLFARGRVDPIAIKPKVFDTILYLVEHPGQDLEKERLMTALWPGLVVEENSLAQAISTLRQVFGEKPGENRYIATIPGRGYRFVAPVRRVEAAPDAAAEERTAPAPAVPAAPVARTEHEAPPRRIAAAGLLLVVAAAAVAYGWYASRSPEAEEVAQAQAGEQDALPSSHVAVLRFESLSADPADAYFAFGLAESLLHRLSAVPGLTLISRTSSFALGEGLGDVREIGRALNARYLVEGSVQRAGERLRVTAQLIDASTGAHVWSLQFDRTVDDVFAVEDEIARGIAQALEVSLTEPRHPYERFGTEVYLAFMQGRSLLASHKVADAEEAIRRFEYAVALAPEFAAGYASLAEAHVLLAQLLGAMPEQMAEATRKAEPLIAKSLQLDGEAAEAYALRAELKANAGDTTGAESDFRRAIALNPNYAAAHERFAMFLYEHARMDEALAEVDKAISVDPLSPRNVYLKGMLLVFDESTGTFGGRSEPYFLKALSLDPEFHPALLRLGGVRWYRGEFADAILFGERAVAVDPRAPWMREVLVEIYLEVGDIAAARHVLAEQPTPVAPEQWLAICWYEGKVQRMAEILRADPTGRGYNDQDVEAYGLRDAAMATGDFARAQRDVEALKTMHYYQVHGDAFIDVSLAQLRLAAGDLAAAHRLAREVAGLEDNRLSYPRAAALTLLGEHEAALDVLEDGVRRGYLKRWWFAFERDMAFEPLRGNPRFQALAEEARAHASAERARLEAMRERGDVPYRKNTVAPDPAGC